jgi:DDB1- and CUL4-associated factor 11
MPVDSQFRFVLQVSGSQVAKLKWHQLAIRDCSWHPFEPTLVSSSWDGRVVKWTSARDEGASDVD